MDRRVIAAMAGVMLLLVLVDVVNGAAGIDSTALELGGERNLSAWFTSAQFALAAVALGSAVALGVGRRAAWGPVAGLMVLFSMDEVVMVHERVEENVGLSTELRVVVLALSLVLVGVLAYGFRGVTGRERQLALAAVAALVLAQVADALSGDWLSGPLLAVMSDAEECFEMLLGTFLLAAGVMLLGRVLRRADPLT